MRARVLTTAMLLSASIATAAPTLTDPNLVVEPVVTIQPTLTGIVFVDDNELLVNRKNTGEVIHVTSGSITNIALDLPVNTQSERGLLDIRLDPEFAVNKLVYLYYTVAPSDGGTPTANRVSRFTWNGTTLTNEDILIDLPVTPGPNHDGGILAFGPPSAPAADQKLFIVIGDLNRDGQTENYMGAAAPDYTGQILRLNRDGSVPTGDERGPFYDVAAGNANLQVLYAYGIRNSYGMEFDPITSRLWISENGPATNDEINIVDPGFNGGWETITGKAPAPLPALVQFGGLGTYSDPEFVWEKTVAPTAIHFVRGDGLGVAYENDCLVGDSNTGTLYHFQLNPARDKYVLTGNLADEILNIGDSPASITLGSGFYGIIDIETAPDGSVYVVTYDTIYRIRSTASAVKDWQLFQ